MMRSVGDALSFIWESDRSCSAARRGGEPLEGRGGRFMLDGRLHNVGTLMRYSLICRLIAGEVDSLQMVRDIGSVGSGNLLNES